MIRSVVAVAIVAASACATLPAFSETPTTHADSQPKHYRMTFVLSYPQGKQAPQTFTLDVPVSTEHAGMAQSSSSSMLTEEPLSAVEQVLQCTDVRESSTGLEAQVSFTMDRTSPPPPGIHEPIHSNLTFQKHVDVSLNQPTRITEEMHIRPLKPGDPVPKEAAPAPQITLTVAEI